MPLLVCPSTQAYAKPGAIGHCNLGSNSDMHQENPIESRLTELEIKVSFQEDLLDKLDQIIIRQQEQIDALVRELVHLRDQRTEAGSGAQRSVQDDLPPHY